MISQDYHAKVGVGSAGNHYDDDLSYLLPVVTPILDEYEDEEESGSTVAFVDHFDADVDRGSLVGLSDSSAQHQEFQQNCHRVTVMAEDDDGLSVVSDITEYFTASEELLYYHNVVARRAMSLRASGVFDDDAESDISESDHVMEATSALPCDDPLLMHLHGSVPQLPRPRLWTVSERGESTATANSENHYLGSTRRSSKRKRCRMSRGDASSGSEEKNDDPSSEHGNVFFTSLSDAGAKVLTAPARAFIALLHKGPTKMAKSPRRFSFQEEDLTVATEATNSSSTINESFHQTPMPSLTGGFWTTRNRRNSQNRHRRRASF